MDADDYKDLSKKYKATFIRYAEKGKPVSWATCLVEDIIAVSYDDPEHYSFTILAVFANRRRKELSSDLYYFNFDFPEVGTLNYGHSVAITTRYPARQWKKAVLADNYKVYAPYDNIVQLLYRKHDCEAIKGLLEPFDWSVRAVDKLFNNVYPTYDKAQEELLEGRALARAISKHFYITLSHFSDGFLIWKDNIIVAHQPIDDVCVTYTDNPFQQELTDYFRRSKHA